MSEPFAREAESDGAEPSRPNRRVNAKKEGITDGVVTLGRTKHVDISGDHAYAVVNATYTWKQNGKAPKEAAIWTFSLVKTKDGWRITGWAWSKS